MKLQLSIIIPVIGKQRWKPKKWTAWLSNIFAHNVTVQIVIDSLVLCPSNNVS